MKCQLTDLISGVRTKAKISHQNVTTQQPAGIQKEGAQKKKTLLKASALFKRLHY